MQVLFLRIRAFMRYLDENKRNIVVTDLSINYDFRMSGIGKRIKEERELRDWSQEYLGKLAQGNRKTKINKDTINRAEHNMNTTIEVLYNIANALGVKLGQLLPDEDRVPVKPAPAEERTAYACLDPNHLSYHEKLETILHGPDSETKRIVTAVCDVVSLHPEALDGTVGKGQNPAMRADIFRSAKTGGPLAEKVRRR